MSAYFATINAFLEDTCVIVVIAYLLTRGRLLTLLFQGRRAFRETAYLGVILGIIGLTEAVFPGARYPYVTHTLIVTFAALMGGAGVGLIAALVVVAGAMAFQSPGFWASTVLAVFGSLIVGVAARRALFARHSLIIGFLAGTLAQAIAALLRISWAELFHTPFSIPHALVSVPANGVGVMLLLLVVKDAEVRANSERNRIEAEHARLLAAESQLGALRARIHPHFLFNSLTSIAALCGVAPEKAEAAIIRLGQLMRRVLETNPSTLVTLGDELDAVRAYLEIVEERFGSRLQVRWRVDTSSHCARVPPFSVQTLVENAINHGIAPKIEPGEIVIVVQRSRHSTRVAVVDSGIGMSAEARRQALQIVDRRVHGLQILSEQLTLVYGSRARIRVFSRIDCGTMAVFLIPMKTAGHISGGLKVT